MFWAATRITASTVLKKVICWPSNGASGRSSAVTEGHFPAAGPLCSPALPSRFGPPSLSHTVFAIRCGSARVQRPSSHQRSARHDSPAPCRTLAIVRAAHKCWAAALSTAAQQDPDVLSSNTRYLLIVLFRTYCCPSYIGISRPNTDRVDPRDRTTQIASTEAIAKSTSPITTAGSRMPPPAIVCIGMTSLNGLIS